MLKYWTAHILAGRLGSLAICLGCVLLISVQGSCQQGLNVQSPGAGETKTSTAAGQPATAPVSMQPASAPVTGAAQQGGLKNLTGRLDAPRDSRQTKQGDVGDLAWQTIGYTILILLLGGAVIILARRLLPKLGLAPAGGRNVKLLETVSLNPRQRVHLLKVGGRRILVGSCRDSLSMLADVTEQTEPSQQDQSAGQPVAAVQSAGKGEE